MQIKPLQSEACEQNLQRMLFENRVEALNAGSVRQTLKILASLSLLFKFAE